MSEPQLVTLEQLQRFLEGTQDVQFRSSGNDQGRYRHIEAAVLHRFRYGVLSKNAADALELPHRYTARTCPNLSGSAH